LTPSFHPPSRTVYSSVALAAGDVLAVRACRRAIRYSSSSSVDDDLWRRAYRGAILVGGLVVAASLLSNKLRNEARATSG